MKLHELRAQLRVARVTERTPPVVEASLARIPNIIQQIYKISPIMWESVREALEASTPPLEKIKREPIRGEHIDYIIVDDVKDVKLRSEEVAVLEKPLIVIDSLSEHKSPLLAEVETKVSYKRTSMDEIMKLWYSGKITVP